MLLHDDWPCTIISKHTSIIHTQSHILVLGLGLGHMLFHDDWPHTIISKHTSIIHTQSRILVLGLGLGHVLFHDDWPCTIFSNHPSSSILNYIYIPSTKCICIYINIYIFMYIWKNPIPNTQYTKRISKDPVSANILPQYWPIMNARYAHNRSPI